MRRHHLERRAPRASLVRVVGDVCGVQAQLMSAAELALWARVRGLARDDVERALWRDRTLVKTGAARGTVHLLPTADFSVLQGGVRRTLVERIVDRFIARHGIAAEVSATMDAIIDGLAAGPRTRNELSDRVVARLGTSARAWTDGGWGDVRKSYLPGWILRHMCMLGTVCFGPNRGAESTFASVRTWVPHIIEMPAGVAEPTLLRSYLRAYGPASLQDFVAWSGLAMGHAKQIRAALGDDAVDVDVDGTPRLVLRADRDAIASARSSVPIVRLLPSFDPYLLGHRDKSQLVGAANYKRVYRSQGWLSPVVLVDGRLVGIWSYQRKGSRLRVAVEPFHRLPAAVRSGIEGEADDLGRFLQAEAEVAFARGGA